jgi:hypothetical protein
MYHNNIIWCKTSLNYILIYLCSFCVNISILILLLRLSHSLNLVVTQLRNISYRHSLTADTQNALLLLRLKFTSQSKEDNNTCNGLLK